MDAVIYGLDRSRFDKLLGEYKLQDQHNKEVRNAQEEANAELRSEEKESPFWSMAVLHMKQCHTSPNVIYSVPSPKIVNLSSRLEQSVDSVMLCIAEEAGGDAGTSALGAELPVVCFGETADDELLPPSSKGQDAKHAATDTEATASPKVGDVPAYAMHTFFRVVHLDPSAAHVKLPVSVSGLDRFDIAIETHETIVSEGPNPILGLWSDSRAVSVWSPGPCESLEACLGMGFSFLRNCSKTCWKGGGDPPPSPPP